MQKLISISLLSSLCMISCISEREAPKNRPAADMDSVEDLKALPDSAVDEPDSLPDMKMADMGACGDNLDEKPCALQQGVCAGAKARCAAPTPTNTLACTPDDLLTHDALYRADNSEAWLCDGKDNDCDGQIDEACCTAAPYPEAYQWPADSLAADLVLRSDNQGYLAAISQYLRNAQGDFVADLKVYSLDLQGRPQGVGTQITPATSPEASIDLVPITQDETLIFYSRDDGAAGGRYVVTLDGTGKLKGSPKRIDMNNGRLYATYDPTNEKIFLLFEEPGSTFDKSDWSGCVSTLESLDACISQKFKLLKDQPDEAEPSLAVNAAGKWLLAWADKTEEKLAWQTLDPLPAPGSSLDPGLKQEVRAKLIPAERSLRSRHIAITVDQDELSLWYPDHNIIGASMMRLVPGQSPQTITEPKSNAALLSPSVQRTNDGRYLIAFINAQGSDPARWSIASSAGERAQNFALIEGAFPGGALAFAPKGALLLAGKLTNDGNNIQAQSMLLSHNGVPICAP